MADNTIYPKAYPTVAPMPCPTPDGESPSQAITRSSQPVAASREVASEIGAYGSVLRYFDETPDKILNFKDGDYYTARMKLHPAVEQARDALRASFEAACRVVCNPQSLPAQTKVSYDLGERSFLGQLLDGAKTLMGFATGGLIGSDPDYGTVGSFSSRSNVTTRDLDCGAGVADVEFSISNNMGMSSNSRFSYDASNGRTSLLPDNPLGPTGHFGTVKQSWDWSERVSFPASHNCASTDKKNAIG